MIPSISTPNHARFWSKVNLDPTPFGCLEWTGATAKGYGVMRWNGDRMAVATRIVMELTYGIFPDPDTVIRHICDNPPCVNPDHLIPGTYAENSLDMHTRNEVCLAEGSHRRKLTYAQVDRMRHLYRTTDITSYQLAEMFGVSQPTASEAITGRSYKRGPTEPPVPARRSRKVAV